MAYDGAQAKENADELVAKKKELDELVAKRRVEAKEFEQTMRMKASTVGNIVGKGVPVSMNEVLGPFLPLRLVLSRLAG